MADYLTTDTELTSIASAIRDKGGTSAALVYPSGFISAIQEIQTVGTYQSKVVSPTESQQVVNPDSGYDALSSVTVNAISSTYIGTGVVTKTAESYGLSGSTRTIPSGTYLTGDQTILPFKYSGISSETIKYGTVVKVGDSEDDDRMISITGGFTGANYVSTGQTAAKSSQILKGYSAWVNGNEVKGNITTESAATINPTENEQIAVAAGKYTMGAIKVAAIDSSYVGSNVPQRTSTDLTASGSIVTIPSGYYAAAASKAVTAGSVTINSPTITANPTVTLNSSTGVVTATVNNNTSVGATLISGYISTYTGGTAQASGSKTLQLTTKSASTYTPSSTTQTIASGQYLTGVQTIAGDSNLVAANIASGVTIFGITGTYTGETYVAMTTQEIWKAAASGWGSTNPSVAAAIWNSVAAGWSISATMTDSTIHTSVASGWR